MIFELHAESLPDTSVGLSGFFLMNLMNCYNFFKQHTIVKIEIKDSTCPFSYLPTPTEVITINSACVFYRNGIILFILV